MLTWIKNSISDQIVKSFVHTTSAQALWLELEDRFGRVSGPQLLMLQRRIMNRNQGTKIVNEYFNELKSL